VRPLAVIRLRPQQRLSYQPADSESALGNDDDDVDEVTWLSRSPVS
jgi:hypothetical protein